MKTHILDVTRVRVYPRDQIPFWKLSTETVALAIQDLFNFSEVDLDSKEENPVLEFSRGYLSHADDIESPLQYLHINAAKIELSAYGDDELIDRALNRLATYLDEFVPSHTENWFHEPVVESYDTIWIGHLNVDSFAFLHPKWAEINKGIDDAIRTPFLEPSLSLLDFSLRVSYESKRRELQNLYSVDGVFRLEPRADVPPENRVWFSRSPLRSEKHLDLLKHIENHFGANVS